MKLGKGPTSLLDRHSTFNDTTALRIRSDILSFHENVSFVATKLREILRMARMCRDIDQISSFLTT